MNYKNAITTIFDCTVELLESELLKLGFSIRLILESITEILVLLRGLFCSNAWIRIVVIVAVVMISSEPIEFVRIEQPLKVKRELDKSAEEPFIPKPKQYALTIILATSDGYPKTLRPRIRSPTKILVPIYLFHFQFFNFYNMLSKYKNTLFSSKLFWIIILCSAFSTLLTTWLLSFILLVNPWFIGLFAFTYFALTAGMELTLGAGLWKEVSQPNEFGAEPELESDQNQSE